MGYQEKLSAKEARSATLRQLERQKMKLQAEEKTCTESLERSLALFMQESTATSYVHVLQKQRQFLLMLIEQKSGEIGITQHERDEVITVLRSQITTLELQCQTLAKFHTGEKAKYELMLQNQLLELAKAKHVNVPTNLGTMSQADLETEIKRMQAEYSA